MCLHAGVQPYPNGTNDFARTQRCRFMRLVAACGHICVCVCCVGVLLCFETSCPRKLSHVLLPCMHARSYMVAAADADFVNFAETPYLR